MTLEGKQFSHYRVLRLIGRGSMGEVYLIEDVQVQRQIAAKVIRIEDVPPEQEAVNSALRLFWREAMAIARLDHSYILPLYDHGEAFIDGSHIAYLTMPYRPEGSLTTWLRQRERTRHSKHLSMKQAAHVIQQAGQALQYAHDHQVMHLDVKPANFLIRSKSRNDEYPDLLLSDFGIARLVSAASRDSQQVRGTPIYMAPEQWGSHPVFASDQYALAIMAYELLTGSPPFEGGPLSVMFAHIHQQPWPVHNLNPLLPSTIDAVLQRALAKDPEERFPSVAAFAQAFQNTFPAMSGGSALRVLRLLPALHTTPSGNDPIPAQEVSNDLPSDHGRADHIITTLERVSQTTQALPSVHIPLPAREQEIRDLPSTTISHTTLPPQNTTALSAHTPSQPITTAQKSLTFPMLPLSRQAIRLPLPSTALAFILLATILLGTGSLGFYGAITGNWPWHAHSEPVHLTLPIKDARTNPTHLINPGKIWHLHTDTPPNFGAVFWLNSFFLAIGDHGSIFTSANDSAWTPQSSGTSRFLESVTRSGSLFVIVGDHGSILTSPDAHTWTLRHSGTTQNLYDVEWTGSLFLAVGDNGVVLSSRNGSTWTQQILHGFPSLYGIIWSGSLFVAVSTSGILTSPDGHNWTHQDTGSQEAFDGLIWSGSLFVVVGQHGTILTSPNGHTWTSQHSGTAFDLSDVDWSGSLFVTVGQSGTILTSSDGKIWTSQHSGTSLDLNTISCSSPLFVSVTQNGSILSSP